MTTTTGRHPARTVCSLVKANALAVGADTSVRMATVRCIRRRWADRAAVRNCVAAWCASNHDFRSDHLAVLAGDGIDHHARTRLNGCGVSRSIPGFDLAAELWARNLNNADFSNAKISDTPFTSASLRGAIFTKATLPGG